MIIAVKKQNKRKFVRPACGTEKINFSRGLFYDKIYGKREKMKSFTHILVMALMLGPCGAWAATPLSGTAGSNLTAYNPNFGAINNNEWNSMMNSRSGSGTNAAKADFGNCNSLILRCASPKCGNGGCTSIDVATPIVAGCVASNAACKQYGDDLTQYIAAQLVASSTAKLNTQMIEAQSAANAAAAEQNAQQMQQMQNQMLQMQQQMADQNAQQIAELQSALEQQQRATENALAQAAAASDAATNAAQNVVTAQQNAATASANATASSGTTPTTVMEGLSEAQRIAANAGVSADILAREQVAGQIMSYLENAQQNLNKAKAAMQGAFTYAGCNTSGDNCVGPKRVSVFRQKAMEFFDPYDAVLDDLYDALVLAQSVGVDITDIYMMLNDSCNVWGEYLCNGGMEDSYSLIKIGEDNNGKPVYKKKGNNFEYSVTRGWAKYTEKNCERDGGPSKKYGFSRGLNKECYVGAVIPPEDSTACTLNRNLTDMEEVQRNFLFADAGDVDEHVRVGCASSALESSKFFRNRKKGSSIDIETLQRMVSQDSPAVFGNNKYSSGPNDSIERYKYCALTSNGYSELERAVATKKLPSRVCVKDGMLRALAESGGMISSSAFNTVYGSNTGSSSPYWTTQTSCEQTGVNCHWDTAKEKCVLPGAGWEWKDGVCVKTK